MGKFKDLTGMKFNRLFVLEQAGRDKYGKILWKCKCDCGKETVTHGRQLVNGRCKSCGCLNLEAKRKAAKYNGLVSDEPRLHNIWKSMIARCYKSSTNCFSSYGGRGISVCKEWANKETGFPNFVEWAKENGYADNLSIDRINNDGNYEPGNCRWADWNTQAANRRKPDKIKNQYGEWDYKMPLPEPPKEDESVKC